MSIAFRHRHGCRWLSSASSVLAALSLSSLTATSYAQSTITVSNDAYASIKGWGCYPDVFNSGKPDENTFARYTIQKAIYGLGFTFIRAEISQRCYKSGTTVADISFSTATNPGWDGVNIDDLVKEIKNAASQGVSQYILASWSPPVAFKTLDSPTGTAVGIENGKFWDGTNSHKSYLRKDREQEYCNWYVAALKYLQSHGAGLPTYISAQNEPSMWNIEYQGCFMEADQWQRVVKLLRVTLDANGLQSVKLFGSDDTYTANHSSQWDMNPAPPGYLGWGFPVLGTDAALNTALSAYAFHTYDVGFQEATTLGVGNYPRDLWMTEWNDEGKGDKGLTQPMDYSLRVARHIAADFQTLPYNYWSFFYAWAKEKSGGDSILITGDKVPVYTPKSFIVHRLFNNVRPGWVSKKVTSDDPDIAPKADQYRQYIDTAVSMAAFESPAHNASVVMIANPTDTAKTNLAISGIKGTQARVFVSTATQNMVLTQGGVITNQSFTLSSLPPRSVVLLETHQPVDNRSWDKVWQVSASNSTDNAPNNAVDGDKSTVYQNGTAQLQGQWFQIKMRSRETFSKLILDSGSATLSDYPRGFGIQVSNDGVNWSGWVARGTSLGQNTSIAFPTQTAQYVRLTLLANAVEFNQSNWWSIAEIQLAR